jgi:ribose transport system ATP-binding protein
VLLQLREIRKRFGGITALSGGNLTVNAGEVHLLLGENGAGKSTLTKIVAGMIQPDAGEIFWRGRSVHLGSPAEASAIGIAMVHQESLLAPHLTVAENIFLGREPGVGGLVDRRTMAVRAARLMEEHRFPLQAGWRVERLSPAGKQLVEICRAIQHGSSLLIFDEPTSSLSESETQEVFRIVRSLRDRNIGVVYITHRMEELRAVGDRVSILRDGATVCSAPLASLSNADIIRHMVGRELSAIHQRSPLPPGAELLRVENLSAGPLQEISFHVRAGEIVGLAGLVGAGRTELCRVLFGLDPPLAGQVFVQGRRVHLRSPREAVQAGLALIPEDRQRNGLATLLPAAHNVTIANLREVSRRGFLNRSAERRVWQDYAQRLRIRAASPRQLAGRLSGGTQQKVVIAKWLFCRARVFLFDEPARGIDVSAKIEVFELMDRLARDGAAILMVSSEMQELLQVADRILVMRQGRLTAELPRGASQEEILRHAV